MPLGSERRRPPYKMRPAFIAYACIMLIEYLCHIALQRCTNVFGARAQREWNDAELTTMAVQMMMCTDMRSRSGMYCALAQNTRCMHRRRVYVS